MVKQLIIFTGLYFFAASLFAQQQPNVILIVADDLGYGDLGCYGQKIIKTPHLDQLAANGIRFTQFYAGTSVCAPSRAALITGMHTGHTPVRGNYEVDPEGQFPLPDSVVTMAEMFQKAGYKTGAFGKWGLGYPGSEGAPERQGFHRFFGYNCQRQSHNYFPGHLWDNGNRIEYQNTATSQQHYAPDLIQAKALEFMTVNSKAPFFLYLAYTLPHAALQLPGGEKVFESFKITLKEKPVTVPGVWDGVGYQPQAYPISAYAAMVTRLDNYVGEVIKKMKLLGIEKNTLVIFTSDNGPHKEGGNNPAYFSSNGGLRGVKRDLYEGGIRVPMVVSWPNVIKPGRVSGHVGAAWDLFPTFAEVIGKSNISGRDGVSILRTLDEKDKQPDHNYLYWEFHEDGGRQAVRMGNWKGVRLNVKKNSKGPIELYDLEADSEEAKDISGNHPAIVKKIEHIMETAHVENDDFPFIKKQVE